MVSLPPKPSARSLPSPPYISSLPPNPFTRSLPAKALIISGLGVPFRTFAPLVPRQGLLVQVIVVAASATPEPTTSAPTIATSISIARLLLIAHSAFQGEERGAQAPL